MLMAGLTVLLHKNKLYIIYIKTKEILNGKL